MKTCQKCKWWGWNHFDMTLSCNGGDVRNLYRHLWKIWYVLKRGWPKRPKWCPRRKK